MREQKQSVQENVDVVLDAFSAIERRDDQRFLDRGIERVQNFARALKANQLSLVEVVAHA